MNKANLKNETNPTVYNRKMRELFNCSYCKPNQVENASGKRLDKKSWKSKRKSKYKMKGQK